MTNGYEWVLKIQDQFSAPVKGMVAQAAKLQAGMAKNVQGVDRVGNSIEGLKSRIEQLKAARAGSFRTDHIRKYNQLIDKTQKELQKLENLPSKKHARNWASFATGINRASEIIGKVSEALSFTSEYQSLQTNVRRFTSLTGNELDKVTKKANTIGEVFEEDKNKIIQAANAMTHQIGGTFSENLALIQAGFQKGANLNGDMLDQLKEYGPRLKAAGLDGAQGLAVMAQAAQRGVFSDKAIDAISEGGKSIREMGKAQVEALAGIGIKANDLVGKSSIEALQMVSKAMQGANDQARQLVLADIFKGAGEDASFGFVDGLASMELDFSKIPFLDQAGSGMKTFFANVKGSIASVTGDIAPWVDGFAQAGLAITGITQVMGGLRLATDSMRLATIRHGIVSRAQSLLTGILTAKQWLLNVAMTANPVGLVVAGIAALTAGIMLAYQKVDWFRGAIQGAWEGLKVLGTVIKDHLIDTFKKLLSGISGIGKAFKHLFSGEWKKAAEVGKEAMANLGEGLLNVTPGGAAIAVYKKGKDIGEAMRRGYENGVSEKKEEEWDASDPAMSDKAPGVGISDPGKKAAENGEGLAVPSTPDLSKASETVTSIATGGKKQTILNVNIEKVLEMGDQVITEGKAQADDLIDILLEELTRRLNGTFRSAGT